MDQNWPEWITRFSPLFAIVAIWVYAIARLRRRSRQTLAIPAALAETPRAMAATAGPVTSSFTEPSGVQSSSMSDKFDVVVIGGGPGGYNAAIRAGQLGMTSACIDKRGAFGGTCLNVGCIPSKALLHASHLFDEATTEFPKLGIKATVELDLPGMMAHKTKVVGELTKGVEFLLKKNKSEAIVGEARITAPGKIEVKGKDGSVRSIEAKNIVIATGSDVMPLPGVVVDEETVVSSTGALSLKSVPKRLLVVGGGYIGLE